ncbi:hypothetical protein FEM48_Zijuj06G0183700 [Ziziphus jujuba var. spinosa]|uniref:Uncharacterized protein n=1 Tax=Ziziphus jujuba var. spinosa TaxID=714518 RepID=A0A978VAW3_ZIZJJ|nr:hypothetical protein FEM48_Zijuj06G0183700 [Ziziphus jujuba var. spinosa]
MRFVDFSVWQDIIGSSSNISMASQCLSLNYSARMDSTRLKNVLNMENMCMSSMATYVECGKCGAVRNELALVHLSLG